MSEHVIQNPVPTPEQMAALLGVSPDRVERLRNIMSSRTPSFAQRRPLTSVSAMKQASTYEKTRVAAKTKDAKRAKTKTR